MDEHVDRAEQHLRSRRRRHHRPPARVDRRESARSQAQPEDPEIRLLRSRAIAGDPDLRALRVHQFNRAHDAIARAVAADTGLAADASGPQMIAAAAVAMFEVVERLAAEGSAEALAELERGFTVLRGALGALT